MPIEMFDASDRAATPDNPGPDPAQGIAVLDQMFAYFDAEQMPAVEEETPAYAA